MSSSSAEMDPKLFGFGFTDLHGFKDFVVYVFLCAPDNFPDDEWRRPDQKMNLERAFVGLRYGLELTAKEKGNSLLVKKCETLVEESLISSKLDPILKVKGCLERCTSFL